jgi:hypothetical protein
MDSVFKTFINKYVPAYEAVITSGYRSPAENEAVDGSEFSAHQYNLARDFALKDVNGDFISTEKLKSIHDEFIKPNWKGYSYYAKPKTGSTGWIHVNLDRKISKTTKFLEYATTGISLFFIGRKIFKQLKKGGML